MTAATPPFPEAALRAVLAAAVAAWTRSGDAEDEPRRWYVDAFAGAEFQFGSGVAREADDPSRATAALQALDARTAAVLVEEDPAHLQRLYAELEDVAGGERLRATRDLASLAPGEVSLVESPFAAVAAEVARIAAGARTFLFLAPPAARALPWDALRPLAILPDATLLIRLPFSDFEKQSRFDTPVADLPGFARRIVEGCSAMLGDPRHAWLPAWRAAMRSGGTPAAMDGMLERFGALLTDTTTGRIVKPVVMEMEDGARAYFFLVTADPAVAMAVEPAGPAAEIEVAPAPEPEPEPEPVPVPVPPAEPSPVDAAPPPASAKKPRRRAAKPASTEEPASAAPEPSPPVAEPSVEADAPAQPAVVPPPVAVPLDLFPEDLGPPDEVILPLPPDSAARPRQKPTTKPRRKKAPDTGWFGEEE